MQVGIDNVNIVKEVTYVINFDIDLENGVRHLKREVCIDDYDKFISFIMELINYKYYSKINFCEEKIKYIINQESKHLTKDVIKK